MNDFSSLSRHYPWTMASERDQTNALIAEQPYVSLATPHDKDNLGVKIIKISDEVSIALKQTDLGSDPLSIINKTGIVSHELMMYQKNIPQ